MVSKLALFHEYIEVRFSKLRKEVLTKFWLEFFRFYLGCQLRCSKFSLSLSRKYLLKVVSNNTKLNVLKVVMSLFKVNNKNTRTISVDSFLLSLLLTLDTSSTILKLQSNNFTYIFENVIAWKYFAWFRSLPWM